MTTTNASVSDAYLHQAPNNESITKTKAQSQYSPSSPTTSSSTTLSIRVQKKILSKLSNRAVVKHLVDDSQITLSIDHLHQVLLAIYPTPTANKLIKNILKVTVKLGLLSKEKSFPAQHQSILNSIENQFRSLTLTVLSFQAVAYSYDHTFLSNSLSNLKSSIQSIVSATLSQKSTARVEFVFEHLNQKNFLDSVFCGGISQELVGKLISNLEKLFEERML